MKKAPEETSRQAVPTWSAGTLDPFTEYYRPLKQVRRYRALVGGLATLLVLQAGVMAAWALKPTPVIVLPEAPTKTPWLLGPGGLPEPTCAQAERFLVHMVQLRYGWRSSTVRSSLEAYLRLSHKNHQHATEVWLRPPGPASSPLTQWEGGDALHVVAPPEDFNEVTCAPGEQAGLWLCQCRVPLFSRDVAADGNVAVTFKMFDVLALLLQTRPETANPWGFVLLDLSERAPNANLQDQP